MNLEYCASIASIKYLFKYIYKGHDCADVQLSVRAGDDVHLEPTVNWDEVSTFLDTRYVSSPEDLEDIEVPAVVPVPSRLSTSRPSAVETGRRVPSRV